MANGTLCDRACNIRVDLVFILPVLGLATLGAYCSYRGRKIPLTAMGVVLAAIVLFLVGLVLEAFGYGDLAGIAVLLGAVAIGAYVLISGRKAKR